MFVTIGRSQTLLLNEQSRLLENEGQKVYKLGFGQSPFMPPDYVQKALAESVDQQGYTPVQGLPELRARVADFHGVLEGRDIDSEQVLIGPGSKLLIYNTLRAFERAVVLIPKPAWVSYAPQAKLIGHTAEGVPTRFEDRWRVTPDALDAACRKYPEDLPKVIILNTPGNPEGLAYSREELESLVPLFEKYGIWVIGDELYALIHHKQEHVSLSTIYPERSLITSGMSKWASAGGWRLGVQIMSEHLPEDFKAALVGIASETFSCAPTPVQHAAMIAYDWNDELRTYLYLQRLILSTLGKAVSQKLRDVGVRVHDPEGGFYLLPDFSQVTRGRDTEMCTTLLKDTGVALLPGSAFGMPYESMTARLAYVDFDGAALMATLESDMQNAEDLIFHHTARVIEGVDMLCDWVRSLPKL